MVYPVGIDAVNLTGTFSNLVYQSGEVTAVPTRGFVQITPGASRLRYIPSGVNYDLGGLVNSYYKLDVNGSFTASLIITNQTDISPTDWSYTVRFSWTDKTVTITPSSATTINISNFYVA